MGELSYDPAACATPSLVVIVKDWAGRPECELTDGIAVALVGVRRNSPEALDPRIKSNNLLNNALAMQQAIRQDCDEGLMLNRDGAVSECAQSNFFLVTRGLVRTPPLCDGLLAGITRGLVLELAAEGGIPAVEASIAPAELAEAEEAFVTSTTREITSVTRIDGGQVGCGAPGPLTLRLIRISDAARSTQSRS